MYEQAMESEDLIVAEISYDTNSRLQSITFNQEDHENEFVSVEEGNHGNYVEENMERLFPSTMSPGTEIENLLRDPLNLEQPASCLNDLLEALDNAADSESSASPDSSGTAISSRK